MHLDAFQRRVHITGGAARAAFLAHDMPGLQRIAQRHHRAIDLDLPDQREAEFEMRREPAGVKAKARIAQLGQHVVKVFVDPVRQHETVVQLGAPTRDGR